MADYKLPDVGEGLTEAEIVAWKVQVGDVIEVNDIVCDIETAKSIVELPSPYAGTVTALLVAEGEMVEVGTPIISIGEPGEAPAGDAAPAAESGGGDAADDDATPEIDLSNPAASGGGEGESLVGRMKADRGAQRRARRRGGADEIGRVTAHATVHDSFNAGAPPQREKVEQLVDTLVPQRPETAPPPRVGSAAGAGEQVLAKPPVRKLARDLGVDLTALTGSGEGGVVTRADVEAAAAGSTAGGETGRMPASYEDLGRPGVAAMGGARETREPIKGVRKMMAQAMVGSAFSAPHVTEWITVDVTRTMEFVDRLKARREFADVKVSPLLVLARACMVAMKRTPEINSFWDESAQEVVYKGYVNLGIAAATPRGLVVPNVKDADGLSLRELAAAINDMVVVAREGRTQPADMADGTFTITNVGVFGVDAGTPIINPGESAIIAFGAVRKQPWVDEATDEIVARQVTTLALSFDHRHIDGALGSQFLADVASIMEDPAAALLF